MNSEESRNLILAIVLSAHRADRLELFLRAEAAAEGRRRDAPVATPTTPPARHAGARQTRLQARRPVAPRPTTRDAAPTRSPTARASPSTRPALGGSINLDGGLIDDLDPQGLSRDDRPEEPEHHAVLARRRPQRLLGRDRLRHRRAAASRRRTVRRSGPPTRRRSSVDQPVTLTWDNGEGLKFTRDDRGRRPLHVHRHRLGREHRDRSRFRCAPMR